MAKLLLFTGNQNRYPKIYLLQKANIYIDLYSLFPLLNNFNLLLNEVKQALVVTKAPKLRVFNTTAPHSAPDNYFIRNIYCDSNRICPNTSILS